MSNIKKRKLNPISLIERFWPDADHSHIKYEPSLSMKNGQFDIVRQCGGDGAMSFVLEMLQNVLINPMNMDSYCKSDSVDVKNLEKINYTIGPIYHSTVFGELELRCGGKYPGQRDRARMPVVCEYIYRKG